MQKHFYTIYPPSSMQIWQWCNKIINDPKYIILDTETTDLNGQAVEISIIDNQGNTLLDTLLKPTVPISPIAQSVHHITETELEDAPTIADIWNQLCEIAKDKTIITYNADFDARIINNTAAAYKCKYPHQFYYQCAMDRYAKHWGVFNQKYRTFKWQTLANACAQQEVNLSELTLHRALADCQTTLRLIKRIAELGEETRQNGITLMEV